MATGQVNVSIENIVNDLPQISYLQIVYEAITNSIQANATKIKINFTYNILDFENDIEDNKRILSSIEVEDNGDGFTQRNIEAFKEYRTKNKVNLGCKGVGRFLYLKLFERVEIKSLDKKIIFTINKDPEVIPSSEKIDKTILKILNPKETITVDFDSLKSSLQEHFIAYFKLLKDKNKEVIISVFDDKKEKFIIKSSLLPKFQSRKFTINRHDFTLSYVFDDEKLPNEGYFCAGKRVVKRNSELDTNRKVKLFKQFKILFLIESEYLDNNVRIDTRDDFTIYPKRKKDKDLYSNISWEEIIEKVRYEIQQIAKENGVDIKKIAKEYIREAIKEAPYLGYYIGDNNDILGTNELITLAKRKLEEDKKYLRERSHLENSDFEQRLSLVTQTELAEYIFDRAKTIERLKKLTDDEKIEKEIHNLFMKQRTVDDKENYKTNNLWLFDDRFMTYDKVFSEKQIREIFPKLSDNIDRPDLLSIISNTYEKELITDIVVIELKRPHKAITPASAEEQLLDYASYINDNFEDRKIRIWTYAFLKFNKDTERKFKNKGYNRVFTNTNYPLYYKAFDTVNAILNFIDYKTLAYDAELRNKTFLKILEGKSINY